MSELVITCPPNSKTCSLSSQLPLFNEENLFPGYQKTTPQILTVKNERSENCRFSIKVSQLKGDLNVARYIQISIKRENKIFYDNSLSQLQNDYIFLETIAPDSAKAYLWTVAVDKNLSNEYQNTQITFNANYDFSCQNQSGQVLGASTQKNPLYWPYLLLLILLLFLVIRFVKKRVSK